MRDFFYCKDGQVFKNLKQLRNSLKNLDYDTYSHHVSENNNDFANWVEHAFNDKELANKLRSSDSKDHAHSILINKQSELDLDKALEINNPEEIRKNFNVSRLVADNLDQILKKRPKKKNKLVNNYKIRNNQEKLNIKVYSNKKNQFFYDVQFPKKKESTQLIIDHIKDNLKLTSESEARIEIHSYLKELAPMLSVKVHDEIISSVIQDKFSVEKIQLLNKDPSIKRIARPKLKRNIEIYHEEYGWMTTNIKAESKEQIKKLN